MRAPAWVASPVRAPFPRRASPAVQGGRGRGLLETQGAARAGPGTHPSPSQATRSSPDRRENPERERVPQDTRGPRPMLSPQPHCRTPSISHQPQGTGAGAPQSFWEVSLFSHRKRVGGGGAWTKGRAGGQGREPARDGFQTRPGPVASPSLPGPQSPRLHSEERGPAQGPPTQTPRRGSCNPAPSPHPGCPEDVRPGVARPFGFGKQSQKSGFLYAVTSFFNICKTFSPPNETGLGPEPATGRGSPTPPPSLPTWSQGDPGAPASSPSPGLGRWARPGRHHSSRPRRPLREPPTYICTCGGWKRPWLML